MVLVDSTGEDGKIDDETRNNVEVQVLLKLAGNASKSSDNLLYFESGWYKGYRIFDCANKESANFFQEVVKEMMLKDDAIRAIPWKELLSVRQPRG